MRRDKRRVKALLGVFVIALLVASIAGCTFTSVTLHPPALTITANPTNPAANQSFTISGTLTANGTTPVPGKAIVLLRAGPSGTWGAAGTTTTDANGSYTFTHSESQGVYWYYAYFAGDSSYNTSTSPTVTVTVGTPQKSVISIFASNYNPAVNQPYTIYGVLQDGGTGAPLAGQPIKLTISLGQFGNAGAVVNMSTTASANGSYSFTTSSAAQGNYIPSVDFNTPSSGYLESSQMTWVEVGNLIPVALKLSITPTNPAVNQSFTMSGTLTDASGNRLPNEGLYIDCQIPDGSWHYRASITTDANGNYSWTYNGGEQNPGQYYYEVVFFGTGTYSTQTTVQELAIGTLTPVTLTLKTNIANPAVGQSFTLSGKLTDANGNPLAGKEIDLYDSVIGGILHTQYTSSTGTYSFQISMPAAGNDVRFSVESPGDTSHQYAITSVYMNIG
jgi:protocatechuate 3,4-dioxygenase beta subunit